MLIDVGQGRRGQKGVRGINIEPEVKVQGRQRVCMDDGLREALREGGAQYKNRLKGRISGAIILVQCQRPMSGGIIMCLFSCQLSPLDLVLLITGGRHAKERDMGQNGAHELTQKKS